MHPVWLIALGVVGAFFVYLTGVAIHQREDWRDIAPVAVAGLALLASVGLDAAGVF